MKPNINILDGIIRLFIAMVIGSVGAVMGWWIGVVAVYFVVTSLSAWDPVYEMTGRFTTEQSPYLEEAAPEEAQSRLANAPQEYKKIA